MCSPSANFVFKCFSLGKKWTLEYRVTPLCLCRYRALHWPLPVLLAPPLVPSGATLLVRGTAGAPLRRVRPSLVGPVFGQQHPRADHSPPLLSLHTRRDPKVPFLGLPLPSTPPG